MTADPPAERRTSEAGDAGGASDPPSYLVDAVARELENRLHKAIMARVSVNVADYASLPRTFSKSKRVIDKR